MKNSQQTKGFATGLVLAALIAGVTSIQASASATKVTATLPSATMIALALHAPSIESQEPTSRPSPGSSKSSTVPLPEGDGMALTKKLCSGCHGTDTFARQRHDRGKWDQILDNMVSKGMEAGDDDLDKVATYLSTYFGQKSAPPEPANPPSASSTQPSADTH